MSRRQPRKLYYAGNVMMMMQGKETGQENDEWTSSYGQNTHSVKYVVEGENVEREDYLKGRRWALKKSEMQQPLKMVGVRSWIWEMLSSGRKSGDTLE